MSGLWQLPVTKNIGGREYSLRADYRDVLKILRCLEDPDLPEVTRWLVALRLFYDGEIPRQHRQEAMAYLARFLGCGEDRGKPGPKLFDWEQDADAIIAGVNKAAGQEIRALPFVHWWTFISWFHGMGEGQLSALVAIRDKLRRGKKLEKWEQEFYRENKHRVDLKPRYSQAEMAEQERLNAILNQ